MIAMLQKHRINSVQPDDCGVAELYGVGYRLPDGRQVGEKLFFPAF